MDLAREHGLSAQAVRNYERDGVLPPAERTATGYRRYTFAHVLALRAYLALVAAHGYATGGEVMRAVHDGDPSAALHAIDRSHAGALRDRETLDLVEATAGALTAPPDGPGPGRTGSAQLRPGQSRSGARPSGRALAIGALARRIGVTPATLRAWERAGIVESRRDPATGHRGYTADDVRDAELAHLLRRGGFGLAHIATVLHQVRGATGPEPLAGSLVAWRQRLTDRGLAMLTAAGLLAEYLQARAAPPPADGPPVRTGPAARPPATRPAGSERSPG